MQRPVILAKTDGRCVNSRRNRCGSGGAYENPSWASKSVPVATAEPMRDINDRRQDRNRTINWIKRGHIGNDPEQVILEE